MLEVKHVSKRFGERLVLRDVSFRLSRGECAGLVGESGVGKSTLCRLIAGLERVDAGEILFEGSDLRTWRKKGRGRMSIVFQNYRASVNPRYKIIDILGELLKRTSYQEKMKKMTALLDFVDLPSSILSRYPHELSGGELQRICIARALSIDPHVLILDEPISSLDAPVQVQILEVLKRIKEEKKTTMLFVAHHLESVVYVCDTVLFLIDGTIAERVTTNRLHDAENEIVRHVLKTVAERL